MAILGFTLEGKSPWYGLAAGALLGAVALGLFAWKGQQPMTKQIAAQEKELGKLNDKIREGRTAQQKLPQFREEVRRLELELNKLKRVLPAERKTQDLLRRVRTLAEQGDFDLRLFKPSKQVEKDFYSEWPIKIELTGNYHNLGIFFGKVSRFPRILNIDSLEITPLNKQTDSRTIYAKFEAKTFVYKEVEDLGSEAAAATPPGRGGAKGGNRKP